MNPNDPRKLDRLRVATVPRDRISCAVCEVSGFMEGMEGEVKIDPQFTVRPGKPEKRIGAGAHVRYESQTEIRLEISATDLPGRVLNMVVSADEAYQLGRSLIEAAYELRGGQKR